PTKFLASSNEEIRSSLKTILQDGSHAWLQTNYLQSRTSAHFRDAINVDAAKLKRVLENHRSSGCNFHKLSWDVAQTKKYATVHGFNTMHCMVTAATLLSATPDVVFIEQDIRPQLF